MNWLQKLWAWFDGKKTTIGAVILMIPALINEVLIGIWNLPPHPWLEIAGTCSWIGLVIAGGGAIHKAQKAIKASREG